MSKCAQVLHFFYDLTSVEQVRHLGCYRAKHRKGASRKAHTVASARLQTSNTLRLMLMHTCIGCFHLRLQPGLVKFSLYSTRQEKREDAALQLASSNGKLPEVAMMARMYDKQRRSRIKERPWEP